MKVKNHLEFGVVLFAALSDVSLGGCERARGEHGTVANGVTSPDAPFANAPEPRAEATSIDAHVATGSGARAEAREGIGPDIHPPNAPSIDARPATATETRVIRFAWRPPEGDADAYAMDDALDQHQIVMPRDAKDGAAYPVLIAFHGQPKRGEAPRNYAFAGKVIAATTSAVAHGAKPVVLVLPVFRYFGTNWPHFDIVAFKGEIERRLASEGLKSAGYYVVGHSGAAGCGGDGMNHVHRIAPAGVGFFDTCLGPGWRDEVKRLRDAHVPTLMIHSLETAGFSPRQVTEYLPTFDFGRAYGPAGLAPSACPGHVPSAPLREQPFRCSADEKGTTRGLIVDSGTGEEGHNALVPIAVEYFLNEYVGTR
jgi:hypothetical protein